MKHMIKFIDTMERVCEGAKVSVIVSAILSAFLYVFAIALLLTGGSIESKYLYEAMAEVATDIFATGIFLGITGDILVYAVDRKRK